MKFIGQVSLFVLLAFWILNYLRVNVLPKGYIFDRTRLQEIGQDVLKSHSGANATVLLDEVHKQLKAEYGNYINDMDDNAWVFNNAGNAMGTMIVLHASISEYLIFFGSATGTEGHTGTHFSDDYFLILTGEERAALPHARVPEVYKPGDSHHMKCGENKQYSIQNGTWALELAQGWIPSMLPFGFLEVFTSTLDIGSFIKTAKISGIDMTKNLLKGKF
jgi:C-8 sterol isomerase